MYSTKMTKLPTSTATPQWWNNTDNNEGETIDPLFIIIQQCLLGECTKLRYREKYFKTGNTIKISQ